MAEEINKRILIASVLKPVEDTRMFGKLAVSLSLNGYEVIVFGSAGKPSIEDGVKTISSGNVNRFSLQRVVIPLKILRWTFKLKPKVIIVTTHELLSISVLARWFTGVKVVYDIQENYFNNIYYTKTFPPVVRQILAMYVRMKEVLLSPFVDQFFLAEETYSSELPFVKNRFQVLPNKIRRPLPFVRSTRSKKRRLLFSGTLNDTTGVFIAIDLAIELNKRDHEFSLTIIGFAAQKSIIETIREKIKDNLFISLISGEEPVPHADIVEQIQIADLGIIAYPPNPSTAGSIPTKLYEYLGYQLPILLIDHPEWTKICDRYSAAVVLNYPTIDYEHVLRSIDETRFFTSQAAGIYWEEEEPKLLSSIRALY